MHVHLREPGQEHKETVATGVASAVAGGFTAVACMPNTKPVNDNAGVTRLILQKAAEAGLARVYPIGAVSRGQKGEELADIAELQGGRLRGGHRRWPAGGDRDPGASRSRVHQHVQHADDRALRGSVAEGRRRRARRAGGGIARPARHPWRGRGDHRGPRHPARRDDRRARPHRPHERVDDARGRAARQEPRRQGDLRGVPASLHADRRFAGGAGCLRHQHEDEPAVARSP